MPIIEAHHVTKSYDGVTALNDFSLTVAEGEIVALLGPDGAGKTSLMRLLCNLIDPDPNAPCDIRIQDVPVAQEFDRIKPILGYMPQTFSLYPDLSVEENMMFYAGIYGFTGQTYRTTRDRMYAFSNLGPFAKRRAGALSGGMKQKLALSCALLHDPRLLILDEPTTGVDPLSRRQFWHMLLELRDTGVTILVATPYMDEVARADRAICIFDGRKLTEATPDDLARQFVGSIFHLPEDPTPELVARIGSIAGLDARRFGAGLHVYIGKAHTLADYAGALEQIGLNTERFVPIEPGIEDRFVQLMEQGM